MGPRGAYNSILRKAIIHTTTVPSTKTRVSGLAITAVACVQTSTISFHAEKRFHTEKRFARDSTRLCPGYRHRCMLELFCTFLVFPTLITHQPRGTVN